MLLTGAVHPDTRAICRDIASSYDWTSGQHALQQNAGQMPFGVGGVGQVGQRVDLAQTRHGLGHGGQVESPAFQQGLGLARAYRCGVQRPSERAKVLSKFGSVEPGD